MRPFSSVFVLGVTLRTGSAVRRDGSGPVGFAGERRPDGPSRVCMALCNDRRPVKRARIIVLVRPGDNVFEVNDRVEVTAVTPRFANNDIYVSPVLATHIETLARQARNAYFAAQEARQRRGKCGRGCGERAAAARNDRVKCNAAPRSGGLIR